jgi:hypothetical protein
MNINHLARQGRALLCMAWALTAAAAAAAEPTDSEKLYQRLIDTETHANTQLAERWNVLVRQRQWADNTGKHKVYARYLEHDPNMQWVKLLVLAKTGDEPTYKEAKVPLARLGKSEQAVVKRIGIMRKQVDEALADAPAGASGEGAGEVEASLERPGVESGEVMEAPSRQERRPLDEPPVTETPPAAAPSPASLPRGRDRNMALMPDSAPWRTDFATFTANFSVEQGADGRQNVSWGELKELQAATQLAAMFAAANQAPPPGQSIGMADKLKLAFAASSALTRLGEVTWEATLAAPIAAGAPLEHDLQLPPPFSLKLMPEDADAGDISRFQAGDRVRFIGRFAELAAPAGAPTFTLRVRLPDDQPAPGGYGGREGGIYRPGGQESSSAPSSK